MSVIFSPVLDKHLAIPHQIIDSQNYANDIKTAHI
jgi:hypothetical protein